MVKTVLSEWPKPSPWNGRGGSVGSFRCSTPFHSVPERPNVSDSKERVPFQAGLGVPKAVEQTSPNKPEPPREVAPAVPGVVKPRLVSQHLRLGGGASPGRPLPAAPRSCRGGRHVPAEPHATPGAAEGGEARSATRQAGSGPAGSSSSLLAAAPRDWGGTAPLAGSSAPRRLHSRPRPLRLSRPGSGGLGDMGEIPLGGCRGRPGTWTARSGRPGPTLWSVGPHPADIGPAERRCATN